MSSTFGGLELGRSALNAFRLGMQTVGHNISNMNTEGYSRQRVNYTTVTPENIYNVGQVGQGMTVSSIERIRDEFLDFQFRDNQATLGYWEKINDLYDSIQNYISEPSSSGVRSAMDTFFTNMQTLQEKPEDTSARQALVTSANSLGSMLGNLINSFNTYNESINLELQQSVDDANSMLHDIAALNKEIYEAETLGQNANDLRDSRDVLIDKLSKMMDISYNEPKEYNGVKGEFFLSVNGRVLVQGTNVRELKAHAFMWDNQVYYDVQVAENEFDIVENPNIAEALATGAEGSYQLTVDRIANGVEWTAGGGNAHCLETIAVKSSAFEDNVYAGSGNDDDLVTFKVITKAFTNGIVLNSSSDDVNTIAISRSDMNGNTLEDLRITITRIKDPADDTEPYENRREIWRITDNNGNIFDTFYQDADPDLDIPAENGSVLKVSDLIDFINTYSTDITASLTDGNRIEITPPANSDQSVKAVCSNGIIGTPAASKITTDVYPNGIVADSNSNSPVTIQIPRNDADGNTLNPLTVSMTRFTIGNPPVTMWQLSSNGINFNNGNPVTVNDLADFINTIPNTGITAAASANNSLEITPLGSLREEKGPGINGEFDIWVGNQGESNISQTFADGNITAAGTFRIVISGEDAQNHVDVTVSGNTLSTDLGNSESWDGTVDGMVSFLNSTFRTAPKGTDLAGLTARAYDTDNDGINDKFEVKVDSNLDYGILSVVDIDESGFAGNLFTDAVSTKYTVNVTNVDTIETIRDKINALGAGLTASTAKGYLTITAGNDEIMTFKGETDDDKELLRRLGLTREENTITGGTRTVSNLNERGTILDSDSGDIPYKLQFRSLDDPENPSVLTVKIDRVATGWKLRAELDGQEMKDVDGNSVFQPLIICAEDINTEDIQKFVNEAVKVANNLDPQIAGAVLTTKTLNLNARDDNGILNFWTDNEKQLEVYDYSGMLGALTEAKHELQSVNMRTDPSDLNDPLNISGSFRIQVGTQGTRVTSKNFGTNAGQNLKEGEILTAISDEDTTSARKHTFRIGVSGDQVDISATWNAATNKWVLSSDLGFSETADETLTVKDLTEFISSVFTKSGNSDNPALSAMRVTSGKSSSGTITQFYIESKDNHLISISDVEGNLAASMGMVNENPVITIDVESSDSLITIRNKINEKYQEEFGLTQPEQWVHASTDNGYLEISADVAGEAQRITLMGSEDGNMQVLRRLGLTRNQAVTSDVKDEDGNYLTSFREVAYIPSTGVAQDASFSLNGVKYLSSDNKMNMARRIPAVTSDIHSRYKATELSEVNPGMWLNLKSTGTTTIRVLHHIRDGSIKGLEEARDEMIPNLKSELDEMAYGLVKTLNAYQYSGYGVASDENTTGVAFFNNLAFKAGAAERLSVTERVYYDPSLIGAAMGKKNADGLAVSGKSGGSGDGTNASRMVSLNFAKVLENGTMSIGGIYDSMLSQVGTEAGHAKLMYTTEATVNDQIDSQRKACSGVNLDEELMDILILNRAFGAMSRYITTMDEMLNTIINGMGLVGR